MELFPPQSEIRKSRRRTDKPVSNLSNASNVTDKKTADVQESVALVAGEVISGGPVPAEFSS